MKLMLFIGQVRLSKGYLCPALLEKRIGEGPAGLWPHAGAINREKHPLKLFSIILDPAFNREVHLIHYILLAKVLYD